MPEIPVADRPVGAVRMCAGELAEPAATDRLGAALATALRPGDVVCLDGPLGAGKTALARAAITAALAAVGQTDEVPSPTFTLVQTYAAAFPIWHADLYRLSGPEEVWELGLEEAFEQGVAFIEWPDRLGALLPARRLEVSLTFAEDGEGRWVEVTAFGSGWEAARDALAAL